MAKIIGAFIAVIFILVGYAYVQVFYLSEDTAEIESYVNTRGATPVPYSWRSKIGKGI